VARPALRALGRHSRPAPFSTGRPGGGASRCTASPERFDDSCEGLPSAAGVVHGCRAASRAPEVIAGVDLTGRRAIVTGASSGIGVDTARALASANAEVTLAVRDVETGRSVAVDIGVTTGNEHVLVAPLDLSSKESVTAFVAGWDGPLHILVDNAGVMATPELRTPESWELQFATNHLGHFALTTPADRRTAGMPRVRVMLTSTFHVPSSCRYLPLGRPVLPWR
jgi:hypothetical protein